MFQQGKLIKVLIILKVVTMRLPNLKSKVSNQKSQIWVSIFCKSKTREIKKNRLNNFAYLLEVDEIRPLLRLFLSGLGKKFDMYGNCQYNPLSTMV
jgi:hypothetical protein